ncbi:MAG: hypothetical protein HGB31_08025 [Erysipelotrichaceae bacterium]|nr:hypothetical protein [Erysipelotrichaceae bacterium]
MDTLRDRELLEKLWATDKVPWKKWKYMSSFYKDKKEFITGYTGFKGSWLTKILIECGAEVKGYSLEPSSQPNLFSMLNY